MFINGLVFFFFPACLPVAKSVCKLFGISIFPRESIRYLGEIVKMIVADHKRSREVRDMKKAKDKTMIVNMSNLINCFFWGMDIKIVPVWQKAGDLLQNMIDAQQDEGKVGKQSKGEYTVPAHLHNVTLCNHPSRCNGQ